VKKAELQGIVGFVVEALGNREKLGKFMADLHEYATELDESGNLTTDQAEALQTATDLVEAQRTALVTAGIVSEAAFDAIEPDESGGDLQKALAIIQTLTGSDDMRRQQVKLDGIRRILANGCESTIPLTVSADSASLGVKSARSGANRANPDRPSVKALKNGLKHAIFWKYSKVWYEILNTPEGMRVFNLNTREELGNAEDRPESASSAQKLITGGWADAFRGFQSVLPSDATVAPLGDSDLS
jgi:hypothetical protein